MSVNFIRESTVAISGREFAMGDFAYSFKVEFDVKGGANQSEIKIMNLSTDTINTFKKYSQIILNAGYRGDVGMISAGFLTVCKTQWDGVDKETTINFIDAPSAYIEAKVRKTYRSGVKAMDVLTDLQRTYGVTIGKIELPTNATYTKGLTISSRLQDAFTMIAKDCKTTFMFVNGVPMIGTVGKGKQIAFELSAETGLIGSPEKLESGDSKDKDKTADYKVRCVLNHNLRPLVAIRIKSKVLNGTAVIVKGSHEGSEDGDYFTEVEVKMV